MGDVLEILALALMAMFFPALLAVVLVALRSRRPQLLLASFYAGGFLAATTVGLVIVFSLQGASVDSSSSNSLDPAFYFVLAGLSFVAAWVVRSRQLLVKKEPTPEEVDEPKSDRLTRALDKGAPYAFIAGLLLCAIPGVSALVALKDIAQLGWSTAETVGMVLVFFLIMFSFIELPLIGFVVAPEQATVKTMAFNSWLDRNANRLATNVLVLIGIFLILRGIAGLV
jgi:Sap, sulfolipid-1-addressing protein